MTPVQIVLPLLSVAFALCALILCAETRRYLIRAQAAATRANTAAERADAVLAQIKAFHPQDRSAP